MHHLTIDLFSINHIMLFALCFGLSFLMTGCIRRYALDTALLDTPSERSAHTLPIPRGGGLAFVSCFSTILIVHGYWNQLPMTTTLSLLLPALGIAGIGWVDDRHNVSSLLRLAVHLILSAVVILWLHPESGFAAYPVPTWAMYFIFPVLILFLGWSTSAFNFMDGINGIAALQAVFVALSAAGLCYMYSAEQQAFMLVILGCAVFGFLLWNFPDAKIFMGDVGSGYLGFILGGFGLYMLSIHWVLFASWLILSAVFFTDATLTLLTRIYLKQPFWKPHNSHAYQKTARQLGAHWPVTLVVFGINSLFLLPLAYSVASTKLNAFAGLTVAYAPLAILGLALRAGASNNTQGEALSQSGINA